MNRFNERADTTSKFTKMIAQELVHPMAILMGKIVFPTVGFDSAPLLDIPGTPPYVSQLLRLMMIIVFEHHQPLCRHHNHLWPILPLLFAPSKLVIPARIATTSRTGQAGGGSFKKPDPIEQKKGCAYRVWASILSCAASMSLTSDISPHFISSRAFSPPAFLKS